MRCFCGLEQVADHASTDAAEHEAQPRDQQPPPPLRWLAVGRERLEQHVHGGPALVWVGMQTAHDRAVQPARNVASAGR